jgi:hypothetical protein
MSERAQEYVQTKMGGCPDLGTYRYVHVALSLNHNVDTVRPLAITVLAYICYSDVP